MVLRKGQRKGYGREGVKRGWRLSCWGGAGRGLWLGCLMNFVDKGRVSSDGGVMFRERRKVCAGVFTGVGFEALKGKASLVVKL